MQELSPHEMLMLASTLFKEEETVRHSVIESKPFVYTEWAAERVDKILFDNHPYLRYAVGWGAGLGLGLYVNKPRH